MVGRYIITQELINHLELDQLNETDDPKLSVVENWILASEEELDHLTNTRWDLHTISNELISPDCQTNEFLLKRRPLKRIIQVETQQGDEWSPNWQVLGITNYRVLNERVSKFRTKDYYWQEETMRVTYEAGYETIPLFLKELVLLLTEKRYVMSRLGQAASDSEVVSVAVIRIQDKSTAALEYRLKGLQLEIDNRLKQLHSMKSANKNIGYLSLTPQVKRYRL